MSITQLEQHGMLLRQILELQHQILERLRAERPSQQWYSPKELARLIGRKPATICGWCRSGRLVARKRPLGRGDKLEWEISADELRRYREHGLLPNSNQPIGEEIQDVGCQRGC